MNDTPWWEAIQWQGLVGYTPLEIAATLCAVVSVLLIARQNILGWPLGIIWAGVSAYLAFTAWSLVSDGILYVSYIPIQVYCWVLWHRRALGAGEQVFMPTWLDWRRQTVLVLAACVCVLVWAVTISGLARQVAWIPAPALLWRDSITTVLNWFAQFLQARKRMENWLGWLIVNLLGIHIYWVKGSPVYSIQYGFFLILGLYGWYAWARSRKEVSG